MGSTRSPRAGRNSLANSAAHCAALRLRAAGRSLPRFERSAAMRMRRCAIVHLESHERLEFDIELLSGGGSGLRHVLEWVGSAPPRAAEIVLSAAEVMALGGISPLQWIT